MKKPFIGLVMGLGMTSLSCQIANAQDQSIIGKVLHHNEPVVGATVILKEKNISTSTASDGSFQFVHLSEGKYTIIIRNVGMVAQEKMIHVAKGNKNIFILSLNDNENRIDSVEITGYNSNNKKAVSLGKAGIPLQDLPQSAQILNHQVIQDQQANRLADVLKNANGVALGSARGSVSENFYSRGYSLGNNNIFRNGMRTNNGGSLEASTLESVEVLKGSSALLYGGVTGGAVVNIETKKPQFNYGGEVSFRNGSYDFYKPTVDVYGPLSNNVAFRVIGTYENGKSFRDYVKNNRTYVNPSLLIKASDKTDIYINGDYLKAQNTPDFGIGTVNGTIDKNIGKSRFLNVPWAFNNIDQTNFQTILNHKFNDNWKLNFGIGAQSYNRDYYSTERVQIQSNGDLNLVLNKTRAKEMSANQQINLTGKFETGFLKHNILVGADADQSDSKNFTFNIDPKGNKTSSTNTSVYDIINVFTPGAQRSDIPDATFKNSTRTKIYRYGALAQDLIEVTSQFKVLAGVRYTYQRTPESRTLDNKGVYTINKNLDKNKNDLGPKIDKAWSPKFALIFEPLKTTSFYVSYANNFTSNTGYDKDYQPLSPSIIDHYEFGIKNDFIKGKLSANVTVYRIENHNFAQVLMLADGTIPDNNMKEFTGKTASDGVEVDIVGTLAEGLNVLAGYSYNHMRYTSTNSTGNVEGQTLVGTTPHTANATVFYTIQDGFLRNLKFGASAFYTGKRFGGWNNTKVNVADGVNRRIPVEAFTTLDGSIGYSINRFSILAKLTNVTNVFNYYVHENYSVNPITPRSYMATLSYKF